MNRFPHAPALQHPERIHPSLWRGSQLAHSFRKTIATGYQDLDAQLPGQGWPTGALIEIMLARPGIGEMQLLKPALLALQDERNIILLNPPCTPSSLCLQQWFPATQHIFWIKSNNDQNTLWAAEKILQHNTTAALLCWFNNVHTAFVHRLHLAARQSSTLFFSFRPASFATQSSVAPLRLNLEPILWGLNIRLLKRRGPLLKNDISLNLYQPQAGQPLPSHSRHDALDQHLPARRIQPAAHTPGGHRHNLVTVHP